MLKVHRLVSNRHCNIYCTINSDYYIGSGGMDVYIEDTSANGTLVNGCIKLRKNDKRLLNTGDEICLLSPQTLQKLNKETDGRQRGLLEKVRMGYCYSFINIYQQRPKRGMLQRITNNNPNPRERKG